MTALIRVAFAALLAAALSLPATAQHARTTPVEASVHPARGGATVYTSRAPFDADNPGLPTETFEEADASPGTCDDFVGPVNATTNNTYFDPGDILPGLSITTIPVKGPFTIFDLFIRTVGCGDNNSVWIGNSNANDDLVLDFSPAVEAVGFDVDLDRFGTTTTIEALDAAGNTLATTTISGTAPPFPFRGFSSSGAPIARVRIRSASTPGAAEWAEVDNVSFGEPTASAVTLSATLSPTTIPAGGGTVTFNVTVTNNTGTAQPLDVWIDVDGPGSFTHVRRLGTGTLPSGATVNRSIPLAVPASAPAGTYLIALNVGTFPTTVLATEPLTLTKSAALAGPSPAPGPELFAGTPSVGDLFSATMSVSAVSVYPNPFRDRAQLTLEVATAQGVTVAVFDALGRRVALLHDGPTEAGTHALVFDGSALPAGPYVVRATGETFTATRRATLVR